MIISWFSTGVSSAIATKLAIKKYKNIEIIYTHIDDQHKDSLRFLHDCEKWFKQKIKILQSPLKNVEAACYKAAFVSSPWGAPCTNILKKRVRQQWERENSFEKHTYIWGLDTSDKEKNRAMRITETINEFNHYFPLIENKITKKQAHGILEKQGIKRPKMYDLGYPNNNCIGCLKGGRGYWNKIKKDFPEVFKKRCEMENNIGGKIFKEHKLSELKPEQGRKQKIIIPDCGFFCQIDGS